MAADSDDGKPLERDRFLRAPRTPIGGPMRRVATLLVVPVCVLAVAACGSSSHKSTATAASTPETTSTPATTPTSAPVATPTPSAPASSGVTISTSTISALGPVLVNAKGDTLYIFVPDNDKKVTCVSGCAAVWPPVKLSSGEKAVAAGEVKSSLLGSDPDPEGGDVVTYAGWPLYTYVADSGAGTASGQALNINGGLWYVISPAGNVIKTTP